MEAPLREDCSPGNSLSRILSRYRSSWRSGTNFCMVYFPFPAVMLFDAIRKGRNLFAAHTPDLWKSGEQRKQNHAYERADKRDHDTEDTGQRIGITVCFLAETCCNRDDDAVMRQGIKS